MMRPKNKTERLQLRQAFIPKGARCILEHENGSELYVYERAGRPCAIAFWGTAAKAQFHHSYRTEEQRQRQIESWKASVESSVKFHQERRAKKAAWSNPLTVGTVLYTSWGYDQTNVEFYVVTKVSGKRVWVAEIAADYEATGSMQGKTWPAMPIRIIGKETMHIAQPSGNDGGACVKIDSCRTAWIEAGREHHTSSYA